MKLKKILGLPPTLQALVARRHWMQSETADFAPGAAIWRTWRNLRVVSDSAYSLYYVKT